jgi:ParB/RepB/Spo0J family partition protein
VHEIDIGPRHRTPEQAAVDRLAASMKMIGLRTPITVRYFDDRPSQDGMSDDSYLLVTGAHRLAAAKQLGWEYIEAFVTTKTDADAELWEIDENLMRAELDAAEHALLTKRRAEIIEAKAAEATSSQVGTKSKKRGQGITGTKAAASVRDQAEKTGESKTKVARSKKRAEQLGEDLLRKVTGTSLAKGTELDALIKLDPEKREELIKKAEAGEDVSAVRALAAEASPATEPQKEAGRKETLDDEKTVEDEIAEPEEEDTADPQRYRVAFLLRIDLATKAWRGCEWLASQSADATPAIRKETALAARAVATAWSALALTLEKSLGSPEGGVQLDPNPDPPHRPEGEALCPARA